MHTPFIPVGDETVRSYAQGQEVELRLPMAEPNYDSRFDRLNYGSTLRLRPLIGDGAQEDVDARVVYVGAERGLRIIKVRCDDILPLAECSRQSASDAPLGC
jgi:hypothetical protein